MRHALATLAVLTLTGCNDLVTERFATLADARSKGAFERGWLPPALPSSGRAIVDRHNLDLNTGTGAFDYDLSDRAAYVESLSRAGAVSLTQQDSEILTITTDGSRWEIRLPRASGHAEWSLRRL